MEVYKFPEFWHRTLYIGMYSDLMFTWDVTVKNERLLSSDTVNGHTTFKQMSVISESLGNVVMASQNSAG